MRERERKEEDGGKIIARNEREEERRSLGESRLFFIQPRSVARFNVRRTVYRVFEEEERRI